MANNSRTRLIVFVVLCVIILGYAISPASEEESRGTPRFASFLTDAPPRVEVAAADEHEGQAQQQQQQQQGGLEVQNEKVETDQPLPPPPPVLSSSSGAVLVPLRIVGEYESLVAPVDKELQEGRRSCPVSSSTSRTAPSYTQCTHGMNDVVSSFIHRDGYWRDCLPLAHLAHFVRRLTPHKVRDATTGSEVFTAMDVGGNIGSCSMLLLSQGFQVVAFEPVKDNYQTFHMSAFLSGYHKDRLSLVRAAATDTSNIRCHLH